MAESFKHMATCACGSVGDVVKAPGLSDLLDPVWVVEHERGEQHRNVRVKVEDKFRLALEDSDG